MTLADASPTCSRSMSESLDEPKRLARENNGPRRNERMSRAAATRIENKNGILDMIMHRRKLDYNPLLK